jgi:hypothetical protein
MKLEKTHPDYNKIVDNRGDQYTIDTKQVKEFDEIQCPNDADMSVIKAEEGAVIIKKKSFSSRVFIKEP